MDPKHGPRPGSRPEWDDTLKGGVTSPTSQSRPGSGMTYTSRPIHPRHSRSLCTGLTATHSRGGGGFHTSVDVT